MSLRALRRAAGLTLDDVQLKTRSVTAQAVSLFERGDRVPTLPVLCTLLRLYGRGVAADGFEAAVPQLRTWREERGLSVRQVAGELGWGAPQLSRIETGKARISPPQLAALLDLYGQDKPAAFLRHVLKTESSHGNSR